MNNTLSGRLRKLFIKKFKSYFKRSFTKMVVPRTGLLSEWSYNCVALSSAEVPAGYPRREVAHTIHYIFPLEKRDGFCPSLSPRHSPCN